MDKRILTVIDKKAANQHGYWDYGFCRIYEIKHNMHPEPRAAVRFHSGAQQ